MIIVKALLTLASAWLYTEFAGYWLHKLLHSEKIEFLSRNHMLHHLVVYPPDKPQRPDEAYRSSTYGRAALLGIGMEWIGPILLILGTALAIMTWAGAAVSYLLLFAAASSLWGWVMFAYVHDGMHSKGFWLGKVPAIKGWFLGARRLHDIHHMDLVDDGRETLNFGICFFFFDRLFGTYRNEFARFNRKGYEAALRRYSYILPAAEAR